MTRIVLRSVLLCGLFVGPTVASARPDRAAAAEQERGVAVVELFTSEGCSSCPPADALLGRIAAQAEREHRAVYALSFHVDYWDRLGWRDRFSSAAYTARQGEYARHFSLPSLYTPQMVVNGERQFVGSDEASTLAAVRDGLAQPAAVTVAVKARPGPQGVVVEWSASQAPAGAVLSVAWVDAQAVSSPNKGENDGRTLHHVNVVRDLESRPLGAKRTGVVTLRSPGGSAGRVIAWVQAQGTGRVLGASASEQIGP